MKLTENEKILFNAIFNYETHVTEATQYLKETYNIDAEFNLNDGYVTLTSSTVNESSSEDMDSAKEYINSIFPNEMLNIKC